MKKVVVAEIGFYDYDLKQRLVEVDDNATWKEAYTKAFIGKNDFDTTSWLTDIPDELEDAKTHFFDRDMMIDVLFL